MPSPLPGMDPYLEEPRRWPDVHQSLITYVRDALQPAVRPRYFARMGERVYIMNPPRAIAFETYPVPLPNRLPRIRVPLIAPDPDVVLDVQAVFDRCYDNGDYAGLIDYHKEPTAPLSPDEATWLNVRLQEKGLRIAT
jgi:hypothetical protein